MDTKLIGNLKRKLPHLKLPYRIIGVVVFGSRVKDVYTEHSDLDLLVVASGISEKRHRRGDEIAILKRQLPPIPLDILMLSKEETISNFKNHNPLFLDIATEGKILLDTNEFLENLIKETRNYIEQNNIIKIRDGWKFPVKAGEPTFLSKVSNKDFSGAMLKDGERDLEIAVKLKNESYYDKSVYHSQQAIEKFIKAILIALGIFKKTHFVGEVIDKDEMPEQWREQLSIAAEISESIEPEVSLTRYPGIDEDSLWIPYEEYEESDANKAQQKAEKVLAITKDFLADWFGK